VPRLWEGTSWLHSSDWQVKQYYIDDTNIAVTEFNYGKYSLKIRQYDFAVPDSDILNRCYEVENFGGQQLRPGFVIYSSTVSSVFDTAGIIFEADLSGLIHYRHGYYYGILSQEPAKQYQLGSGARDNAGRGQLYGNDTIGMMKEGSLLWDNVELECGGKLRFSIGICFSVN
jgi:hypothetical protein